MKLKKKVKIIIAIFIIVVILAVGGFVAYKYLGGKKEPAEVKVLKSIDEYGYRLKDNKNKKYKELFKELEDILRADEVNDEAYVNKIAEMFICDFYSLADKSTKTDVGGVDFVHPSAIPNFMVNAENTYYKYVESNMYGERKQSLPTVDTITVSATTPTEYVYNNTKSPAYEVKLTWTYTDAAFSGYQNSATLIFVKEDIKYHLVELQ